MVQCWRREQVTILSGKLKMSEKRAEMDRFTPKCPKLDEYLFLNPKPSAISWTPFLVKKSPKLLCQILKKLLGLEVKKYGNLWNLSLYYCCTVILYHRKSCGSPMWSIHFIYQLQYFPWLFSEFDSRSQCFVHILQISLCHQFTRWHIHSRTYWLKKILYYAVEVLQFTLKVTTFWEKWLCFI